MAHDWEGIHRELVDLAAARAQHEHLLAKTLLRALDAEVWKALGFASFVEYAERVVGLTPRQTEERLRVARELLELPRLDEALGNGEIHFSALREVTRVATAETEVDWLEAVKGKSVGEVAKMVAGRGRGDLPEDPELPELRRHRVVLDLSGDVYATFRAAIARLRKENDGHMTEEDAVLLMSRIALGGPRDEGRSSYQIMMTVCEGCGRASQDGRGEEIPVDAVAAETAQCDAQRMDAKGHLAQDIPPATRRLVARRQHGKCAVPGCRHSIWNDIHHLDLRSEGGDHDPERLILVCATHHSMAHQRRLTIEGSFTSGLTFRHADGTTYGQPTSPAVAMLLSDTFLALKTLGFKEKDARLMVDRVRPRVGANDGVADVVRSALRGRFA